MKQMIDEVREHYNLYYRYEIQSGDDAGTVVNRLYNDVMRNDKDAIEQVIRILASNTYFLAAKKLSAFNILEIDNLDDLMQEIITEVFKKAFRGFPEYVTFYLEALSATESPPYQVITYCYAILIPQILKKQVIRFS